MDRDGPIHPLRLCRAGFLFLELLAWGYRRGPPARRTADLIDKLQGGLEVLLKRRLSPPRLRFRRVRAACA